MGLPVSAAYIAVMTAITESNLRILANTTVPASQLLPHDGEGSDHDSVGLFQQRASWGSIQQRMDAAYSTLLFLDRLPVGWQSMAPGVVAQKIQVSAFPDRYQTHYNDAVNLVNSLLASGEGSGTQLTEVVKGMFIIINKDTAAGYVFYPSPGNGVHNLSFANFELYRDTGVPVWSLPAPLAVATIQNLGGITA